MLDNITGTFKSSDTSSFDVRKWKTKIDYRKRNRMKITFKLDQQESEAFENFKNQTQPDQISDEQFIKSLFFLGLTTLETNLQQQIADELAKRQPEVEIPQDTDLSEFNTPESSSDTTDASI